MTANQRPLVLINGRTVALPTGDVVSSTYIHHQAIASSVWVVTHNLGSFPSVTIVDSAGTMVMGSIQYNSDSQFTITFSGAFAGKAYLN
jgi:hypothetical protein